MAEQQIQVPNGLIVCTTYGSITQQTAQCLMDARSFCEKNGLANLGWRLIPGTLVEKARNESVRQCLREGFGFLFFIDGDTTFAPDAVLGLQRGRRHGWLVPPARRFGAPNN